VPRKLRSLITNLEKAGFQNRGSEGSQRNFEHHKGLRVTLSGKPGDDARHYQKKEVRTKIEEALK
jgi:predicted RNA binding protein YcfA (HicA-like mRNA interferase family)